MRIVLWILEGFALLLLVLLLLPVGLQVRYDEAGFLLRLAAGPIHWQLIPDKHGLFRKKEKPKSDAPKPAGKKPSGTGGPQEKRGGSLEKLRPYVPVCREFLNAVRRRLLVRRLELLVNLADEDPCDLALRYGRAWAAVGAAQPLLERAFRIRRKNIQVLCDFTQESTRVYLNMVIVACPARLLPVLFRYGLRLIRIYDQQKSNKGGAEL